MHCAEAELRSVEEDGDGESNAQVQILSFAQVKCRLSRGFPTSFTAFLLSMSQPQKSQKGSNITVSGATADVIDGSYQQCGLHKDSPIRSPPPLGRRQWTTIDKVPVDIHLKTGDAAKAGKASMEPRAAIDAAKACFVVS